MGEPPNQAYVSYYLYGSPGHFYGIKACRFVTEVDGKQITDLDSFLSAVSSIEDGEAVRLKTSDLQGQVVAVTLRTDDRFWPAPSFRSRAGDWSCGSGILTRRWRGGPSAYSRSVSSCHFDSYYMARRVFADSPDATTRDPAPRARGPLPRLPADDALRDQLVALVVEDRRRRMVAHLATSRGAEEGGGAPGRLWPPRRS